MHQLDSVKSITLYPWAASSNFQMGETVASDNKEIFNEMLISQSSSLFDDLGVKVSQILIAPQIKPFNTDVTSFEEHLIVNSDLVHSVDSLASEHQKQLADKLLSILGNAVRIRTQCQSERCSRCIKRHLSHADIVHSTVGTKHKLHNEEQQRECYISSSQCSPSTDDALCSTACKRNDTTQSTSLDGEGRCYSTCLSDLNYLEISNSSEKFATGLTSSSISSYCGHTRVAVLFSGGIDSLLIAALADRCLPGDEPIDLLNVAFEQAVREGQHQHRGKTDQTDRQRFSVPDRQTGISGFEELQSLNPNRQWNFVQIDITLKELQKSRVEHVKDLVYPLHTVLDDSIGCALWFASRGQGTLLNKSEEYFPYTSPARVVLVGMGADEQLAGYSRHRAKYNTCGWPELINEIQMEIGRISARNLGRDDRIISDHSREARFPFLDENVVSFLNELPLNEKVNLNLPRGIGEKFLLRLAAERLGLTKGATVLKRAIQFGSKIAKAENHKEKGSDSCDRLL